MITYIKYNTIDNVSTYLQAKMFLKEKMFFYFRLKHVSNNNVFIFSLLSLVWTK